jgi:transposase
VSADAADLPDDPDALKALLRRQSEALTALQTEVSELRAERAAHKAELERLRVQLAKLRRQRFGQSSEKLDAKITQLDLLLEDLDETEGAEAAEETAKAEKAAPERERSAQRRKKAVRQPLPEHLPREIIELAPEITCSCCAPEKLVKIGEDVTEVLEKIPVQMKVIRYVRPKLACRGCETIFQAPSPDLPISKGRPGPALIAHVAVGKYCDGLPLYRQSDIYARQGVVIERQTLADWMGHAAFWLAPLGELIGAHVFAAPAIHSDDTPIRVLCPGLGRTRMGRLWTYVVDERPWAGPRAPAAYYRYSSDRKGERPREHLAGYRGFLHADAYQGYEALYQASEGNAPKITHVACMAHARRHLFDVYERTKSPIAEEALRRIQALYAIEAEINGKPGRATGPRRPVARSLQTLGPTRATPDLLQDRARQGPAIQPEPLGGLTRYIGDGRLAIDNNAAERSIRGIALTRKNFLFLGSDEGGHRAAIFYTVTESARLNDLDPEAYMADVIDRLAKRHPINRLAELLPWNWKAARNADQPQQRAA